MIYIVNRFTSSMLAPGKRAEVHLEISQLKEQALPALLQDKDTRVHGMTMHFAGLLSQHLGVSFQVTPGKFTPQVGDTIIHVTVHGETISGRDALPEGCWIGVRSIKFVSIK